MCVQLSQSWIMQLMLLLNSERILCQFSSDNFEQYTCRIYKLIGRRFCNSAVANFFFNNKRRLSTDSAIGDVVRAFKKDREKYESFWSFITPNFYFLFKNFIT